MLKGIVFAEESEAYQIINKNDIVFRKETANNVIYYAHTGDYDILFMVSGLGMLNAAMAVNELLKEGVGEIYNIGTCGYSGNTYGIGDIVIPRRFYNYDFDLSVFGNLDKDPCNVNSVRGGIKCYSTSKFCTEKLDEDEYIVDMEAYGIVAACKSACVKYRVIKIISDLCCRDSYKINCDNVINNVQESIKRYIF